MEKDMNEIWRGNLNQIAGLFKTKKDFASALEARPVYFYQLLSGSRPLGDKMVRNFERKMGLDYRWLDQERSPEEIAAAAGKLTEQTLEQRLDIDTLREVVTDIIAVADDDDLSDPAQIAQAISLLYQRRIKTSSEGRDAETREMEASMLIDLTNSIRDSAS